MSQEQPVLTTSIYVDTFVKLSSYDLHHSTFFHKCIKSSACRIDPYFLVLYYLVSFIKFKLFFLSLFCAFRVDTFSAHFLCLNLILIVCAGRRAGGRSGGIHRCSPPAGLCTLSLSVSVSLPLPAHFSSRCSLSAQRATQFRLRSSFQYVSLSLI